MKKEKEKIILREGSLVEVTDYLSGNVFNTHALIGRASKPSESTLSLEARRRALFLPEIDINNGNIVKNLANGEQYIVVSMMDEVYKNEVLSKVCIMLKCNGYLTVLGEMETADEDGNIKSGWGEKYGDVPVYVDRNVMDLEVVRPGVYEFVSCYIYAPGILVSTLDKLVLRSENRNYNFKAISTDYVSYPGLVIISAETETRR